MMDPIHWVAQKPIQSSRPRPTDGSRPVVPVSRNNTATAVAITSEVVAKASSVQIIGRSEPAGAPRHCCCNSAIAPPTTLYHTMLATTSDAAAATSTATTLIPNISSPPPAKPGLPGDQPFLVIAFTRRVEAEPLVSTATGSFFFGAGAANVKYLLLIYGNEQSRQIWDQMSAENRLTRGGGVRRPD